MAPATCTRVLLHARAEGIIRTNVDRFARLRLPLDVARTLQEGIVRMRTVDYGKIFIGYCVPVSERIALMEAAGSLHLSLIEIQDRNTIYKELHVRSQSVNLRI
jgi:hypothetical protein